MRKDLWFAQIPILGMGLQERGQFPFPCSAI
jgi:hypothetical protein